MIAVSVFVVCKCRSDQVAMKWSEHLRVLRRAKQTFVERCVPMWAVGLMFMRYLLS